MADRKSSKQWRRFPMTLDDNYKRRLKPVTERIRKLYNQLIEPELKDLTDTEVIPNKSFDESESEKIERLFHKYLVEYYGVAFALLADPKTLPWRRVVEKQVKIEGKSVARFHKLRFKRNADFVAGVDPIKSEPWLNDVLKDWTAQNVSLIKDIPNDFIDQIQQDITESVLRGDSMSHLKGVISKTLKASDRRLSLIARDQTNKLYGALTKFRSQANGWDFYEWSNSNDSRVRPDHRKRLDSKIWRFSEPPVITTTGKLAGQRGAPGQAINCRCVALVKFEQSFRFKKNTDGSYKLIPVADLPPQDQKRIA